MRTLCLALLAPLLFGCSRTPPADPPDLAVPPDLTVPPDLAYRTELIMQRPYKSYVPKGYDAKQPAPLLLLLHGLGDTGENLFRALGFPALADEKGLLVAYPDGTIANLFGNQTSFWSATEAFDVFGKADDVGYLDAVISDMVAKYSVDGKRIYVFGYSNGGFMAHRLACERAARIAAIVSLAGGQWLDPAKCQPSEPVAAVQIHGTKDTTIPYAGGNAFSNQFAPKVPGAAATIAVWVERDRCMAKPDDSAPPLDLDGKLAGAETTVRKWPGCTPNSAAELWTIAGATHQPAFSRSFLGAAWGFLAAHPKR